MKPSNFKIGVKHSGDITTMLITTCDNKFVGRACMKDMIDHCGLEVLATVSSPEFSTFLYQSMAKYAYTKGKSIASRRDGATHYPATNIWNSLYQTLSINNKIKIPEQLNRNVIMMNPEYENAFTHSYFIPTSEAFISSLIDLNEHPARDNEAEMIKQLQLTEHYFDMSSRNNGSEWTEEQAPFESKVATTMTTEKHVVGDILIDKGTFLSVLDDIKNGLVSRSSGPIECVIDIDGDLVFFDGHYRYVEAILKGRTYVLINTIHSEYVNGFIPDVERPNKKELISISDINNLISISGGTK